jgi:hypothetical protein
MQKWFLLCLWLVLISKDISANPWGRTGHHIVASIAFHFLDQPTKDSLLEYFGEMTLEEASTWMDEVRSNPNYDYMKPWHYINVEKNDKYKEKADEENIINELDKIIIELKNRDSLSKEKVILNLKIIAHLMGDLHQPLHVGYGVDKGGNLIQVNIFQKHSNLHKVWDSEIIDINKITEIDCLDLLKNYSEDSIAKIQRLDLITWLNDSRLYLNEVYNFTDSAIDEKYIEKNSAIVKNQLLKGGLRLAYLLNNIFNPKT